MILKRWILSLLLLVSTQAWSQYNNGIALSRYAPLNTLTVNPSSIAASGAYMDIQLFHAGLTVQNNVAFYSRDNFRVGDAVSGSQQTYEPVIKRTVEKGMAQTNVDIRGLGFMINVKKWAFAFNTRFRNVTSIRNLPPHLVIYAEEGFNHPPLLGTRHKTEKLRINTMAWGEISLSAATILQARSRRMVTGGVTLKRILSPGAAHVYIKDWDYAVYDSTRFSSYDLEARILAGSMGFEEDNGGSFADMGKGWGVDLGFTIYEMQGGVDNYVPHDPNSGCRKVDYDWKLGVALLDVGYAKFKNNTYELNANLSDSINWANWDNFSPDTQQQIEEELTAVFQDGAEPTDSPATFWLPTTLSLTFDKRFYQPFSLGLMWQQGIPRFGTPGPQGSSQMAVVPRLEWKRLEFAMPLRLYEYRFPQMGLAVRLNSLVIGSDKIGAILFNRDHNGADFYMSFKYTIFKNFRCPKDRKIRGVSRGKADGKFIPCPKW